MKKERKKERVESSLVKFLFVRILCVDGCLVKYQDRMKPLARISLKKCVLNYIKTIDNDCIR